MYTDAIYTLFHVEKNSPLVVHSLFVQSLISYLISKQATGPQIAELKYGTQETMHV